ncbi:hypothetical protein SCYAM73S_03080 [Streptomyces cyaneofuscatus]
MAAPSPITNPSRSSANGRDAPAGSAVRVESAPIRANAVTTSGVSTDSAPPATTTSQDPPSSRSRATAIAVAPEAQAVAGARDGPPAFRAMATSPAAALGIIIGTSSGETASGPEAASLAALSTRTETPPTPTPRTTPTRPPSHTAGSRPASATACRAATTASFTNRAIRHTERPPTASSRSIASTGQAKSTGRPASSSHRRAVECPEHSPSQKLCSSAPAGVTRPTPVTAMAVPVAAPVP